MLILWAAKSLIQFFQNLFLLARAGARVRINEWRKIIKILSDENKTQSDRFWKASKILASEKKSVGVVCELKRSMLNWNIVSLINQKVITMDDLSDFSSELQEHIALMMRG